jgi:hypothetical protein
MSEKNNRNFMSPKLQVYGVRDHTGRLIDAVRMLSFHGLERQHESPFKQELVLNGSHTSIVPVKDSYFDIEKGIVKYD